MQQVQAEGFAIFNDVLDEEYVTNLIQQISGHDVGPAASERSGKPFGIRDLLTALPTIRELANSERIRSFLRRGLSADHKVVRAIYLDKHRAANWKVAWHQDLTIAVRKRKEVDHYGPWSIKAGIQHVQPPTHILENMLAVRIHLDDADHTNGALRVFPASHRAGRLAQEAIQAWRNKCHPVTCEVKRGGVMLMKPLLLHASSAAAEARHRRVIHLEYASVDLDEGLEWHE